jgi:hypothetical protein
MSGPLYRMGKISECKISRNRFRKLLRMLLGSFSLGWG